MRILRHNILRLLMVTAGCAAVAMAGAQQLPEGPKMDAIEVRWWGQACFSVSDGEHVVVVDPFPADFGYKPPEVRPQVVLVTHEHRDHNAVDTVKGEPVVLRGPGRQEAAGLVFTGVAGFHDDEKGGKRGANTLFVWEMAGLRLAHVGDLGGLLSEEQIAALGTVDVLMIPVGGYYTLEPPLAVKAIEQVNTPIVLPMHYRTEALSRLPVAPVEEFLKVAPAEWKVERPEEAVLRLTKEDRPATGRRVIVLPYE